MFKFKTVQDINVKNKRVLVRVDFNLSLDDDGKIADDFRIKEALPTIEYLLKKGAKVILMSHLGDPEGKFVKKLKMDVIQNRLLEYLDYSIVKAKDCIGKEIEDWTYEMQPGEILLLENLRFHPEEEANDIKFAKSLAKLGDIYVNEAFGVSHRKHASIVGVPKFLPSAAGFCLQKEAEELSGVLFKPKRPLVVIIGGAKVSTKIKVIEKFLEKADKLLLGGALVNTVFAAKGLSLGKSFIEKNVFEIVEKLNLENPKIQLPNDFTCQNSEISARGINAVKENESVFDIGPQSVELFLRSIREAKTIVWNGPVGLVEKKPFERSSEAIAKGIAESSAYSIVGGGDTVVFIRKLGLEEKFNYVSTGGGAMLDYLVHETLPGIEALKKCKKFGK